MTTNIVSGSEPNSEAESYDFGGFAFLGENAPRREAIPMLYVPEEFHPQEHLRPDLHRYGDHARYLLHLIHVRSIFDKRTKNGWVALKADYLRRFLPWRQYKVILDDLEAGGVIEVKRNRQGRAEWRTGRRSKLYRFGAAFRAVLFAAMSRKPRPTPQTHQVEGRRT